LLKQYRAANIGNMQTTHSAQLLHLRGTAGKDAIYRKITWRLLPLLMLCYAVAYLDRVNIGYAKLQIKDSLAFSDQIFAWGAGAFFIGYCLFALPCNLLLEKIGARKTLLRIMLLWGATAAAGAFVRTPLEFYTIRFLLGVFEAGFFPGVILYLTCWYPAARRARVLAVFASAALMAAMAAGPLCSATLQYLHLQKGLDGWQWLLVAQGLPAALLGVAACFYLDDQPADANWLSPFEQQIIAPPITLDQAMAHPDWIGNPWKPPGGAGTASRSCSSRSAPARPLRDIQTVGARPACKARRSRMPSWPSWTARPWSTTANAPAPSLVRNGDLFERDLKSGALVQITRGSGRPSPPQYSSRRPRVQFRIGDDWFSWDRASRLVAPVAVPRAAKDPASRKPDALRDMQLRLIATLKRQKDDRDAAARAPRKSAAPTRPAPRPDLPGRQARDREAAPCRRTAAGCWSSPAEGRRQGPRRQDAALRDRIGYEETSDERTRVGRKGPQPHGLKLVDLPRAK
jgi:hypothetical protein